MNFTREPIIETVITPREGCKLVVRSSKGNGQEDYFVDAIEVVSFGHSFFFRSQERPKAFLVPVSDYEILETKETRMVLKNVSSDRSIKISGGREAPPPLVHANLLPVITEKLGKNLATKPWPTLVLPPNASKSAPWANGTTSGAVAVEVEIAMIHLNKGVTSRKDNPPRDANSIQIRMRSNADPRRIIYPPMNENTLPNPKPPLKLLHLFQSFFRRLRPSSKKP